MRAKRAFHNRYKFDLEMKDIHGSPPHCCALSWLHRHRKLPPCSMGGCLGLRRRSKPLFGGDMTEEGCKLMATLGVVVNSLGNLEAVFGEEPRLAYNRVLLSSVPPAGVRPLS
jgi:hypothetical protein